MNVDSIAKKAAATGFSDLKKKQKSTTAYGYSKDTEAETTIKESYPSRVSRVS